MSKGGSRGASFALGLIFGIAIALAFLVWAVPEFRDPALAKEYYDKWQAYPAAEHNAQNQQGHFWVSKLYGVVFAEDLLPQWIMALVAVAATIFTIIAVGWARKAVSTSEAEVRAYFRVKHIDFEWEQIPFDQGFKVNRSLGKLRGFPCSKLHLHG